MLFGARALQGAFGALLAPAALSLITVTFTEVKERATAFGVYGAIAGGGAAIGLILGGVLTEFASWRWCLLVNVPIAILAALAATAVVRESRAHGNTSYDIPGAVSVTGGLVALVYGFTRAAQDGWTSSVTLLCLGVAAVLLATFVAIELRTTHPLLPMRVILDRNRGGSYLSSFMAGSGLFGMFLFLTFYFQGTLGYSALKTGFAFLPFSVGIIVAATISSKLLPRTGPRLLMAGGFTAATLGPGLVEPGSDRIRATPSTSCPPSCSSASGMGLAFVPMSSTALLGVADHDAGVASALVNTTQQVGGSLGHRPAQHRGRLGDRRLPGHPPAHPDQRPRRHVHGYTVGFLVGAACLAVAPSRRRSWSTPPGRTPAMAAASASGRSGEVPGPDAEPSCRRLTRSPSPASRSAGLPGRTGSQRPMWSAGTVPNRPAW